MGNSGWTADPDDLTIPPGGAPPNQFIYIGDDDPLFEVDGANGGLAFHFGDGYGFVLGIDQFDADSGALYIDACNAITEQFAIMLEAFYDADTNDLILGLGELAVDVFIKGDYLEIQSDRANFDHGTDVQYDGTSLGRGIVASVSVQSGSAFVSAETVVLTVPSATYEANRAYRVYTHGGVGQSSAGGIGDLRLKKTNTGGQTLAEFYRFYCPTIGAVYPATGVAHFKTGNSEVTASLVLTLQCPVGTVQHFGTAGSARDVIIEDIGDESSLAGGVELT